MEEFDIHKYFEIFRRRRVSYLVTFAALLVVTIYVSTTWSRYRSTATLQIAQPTIPQGMAAPIGSDPSVLIQALAGQQIEQIERSVTSTASLVDIITKFNLYGGTKAKAPLADLAMGMHNQIKVKLVESQLTSPGTAHSGNNAPPALAFDLSFTYGNPLIAQKVTNELVTRFLDEDLKRRHSETQETVKLLDSQIADLESEMTEQESKISSLREKSPDSRPEVLALNQQAVMSTFMNLQSVETELSAVDKSRANLRAQMAGVDPYSRVIADGQVLTTPDIQLKALQAKYATMAGQYGPDHPDVIKLRHQIEGLQAEVGNKSADSAELQAQIASLRTNLAAASKTYGPDHPDVKSLQAQLTTAEDSLARLPTSTAHDEVKKDADNPAYLMLRAQLEASEQQYISLQTQRDNLKKQYAQYQRNVTQTPVSERELASLLRDNESAQLRFRELKEKRQAAQINAQMDEDRTGARLSVVDQPELPTKTAPSRFMLFVAGLVVSLGGGFGGVIARELLSRSVNGSHALTDIVGAPPLVVIPHIATREERLFQRKLRLYMAGGTVGVLVLAIVAYDQFIQPLDTLF